MKRAFAWLPATAAVMFLACAPGGSGTPDDERRRRLAPPKRDALLGPASGSVLLLGTYDFHGAILQDKRSKAELDTIVEKLVEFQPTKVAVGLAAANQAALDAHYEAYVGGKVKPDNSAIDRIALRVAAMMRHERVWAIDAPKRDERPIDLDGWAEAHGQTDLLRSEIVERYDRWYERERRYQTTESIEDNLVWLNDPRRLAEAHGRNLVGEFDLSEGTEYPGADALTGWYNRHLRIFANLQRVTPRNGERLLVVIDAAHVSLLRHSLEASPRYDLVEVKEFLGVPQGAERQVVPLL